MAQSTDFLSILQLTDLHLMSAPDATLLGVNTAHYFHAVLEQALSEQSSIDLILLTGDLAQEACPASYDYLLSYLEQLQIPCLCLPGNHDDVLLMAEILSTNNISCRKQVILGNWQIICLNSQILGATGGFLKAEELGFLQQCLQNHPDHHALVALHHHCLPTHSAWMDTMMITNSEDFLAIVSKHKKTKLIVNGHIHQEMDRVLDGIRILATPSTCFQFTPRSPTFKVDNSAPGYRAIKLYGNGDIETNVALLPGQLEGLQISDKGY